MANKFLAILALLIIATPTTAETRFDSWAIYYSDKARTRDFEPFQLLVLDSQTHPNLQALQERGKTLLGYLSLGEVAIHHPWFKGVQNDGLVQQENPNWPGSFSIDIRDKRWTKLIIEQLIPWVLRKGFDGLFLDTLDTALSSNQPEVRRAAIDLIKTIRNHYPNTLLMLNRAFEILPEVAGDIDFLLAESIYTDYNFETQKHQRKRPAENQKLIDNLKGLKSSHKLQIMTLDYWPINDNIGVSEIYSEQRQHGFTPYVSTISLDKLIAEPPRTKQ